MRSEPPRSTMARALRERSTRIVLVPMSGIPPTAAKPRLTVLRRSPVPQPRQWATLPVHRVFRGFTNLSNSLGRIGALPHVRALIVGAVFRIRAYDEKIPAGVDQPMAGPGG